VGTDVLGNGRSVAGERVADRYELEELVGSGGMSSVYRARDTLLERHVALKILHAHYTGDDEYVERFRREARAVARLSHPNIVTVIDRGEDGGRQFIVFEYVDGENLKELVTRSGPLSVRRALELGVEIARGLAFAHDHGLVHRDVKPQNVLLNGDGEAKVTDFGIARSLDVEHGMTQTGTVLGTSNYIAPEQASGSRISPQTDVYSLGVVLFELLTGDVPFPGENFVAVAMKHINEPPPNLLELRPDVPLRLAVAIDRALAKDPAARFPTMADFAAELDACLRELDAPDTAPTAIVRTPVVRASKPRRARPRRFRGTAMVALLGLLLAGGAIAAVLVLDGSNGGNSEALQPSTPIQLAGVSGYDPHGSGVEHDQDASLATDGDPATGWTTEHYASQDFGGLKDGVGLVVDAGRVAPLKQLVVTSDTPGFTARVQAGDSSTGPFTDDSASRGVGNRTTLTLQGQDARYYVIWITQLPPGNQARINEVVGRA
jgi:eukaryotic-like serine/threonine-protein kinase